MNGPSALGLGAVPRFLTLYLACTPCTASASHAAWETAARLRQTQARLSTAHTLVVATEARARTPAASTKCLKISACTGSLAAVSSGCH